MQGTVYYECASCNSSISIVCVCSIERLGASGAVHDQRDLVGGTVGDRAGEGAGGAEPGQGQEGVAAAAVGDASAVAGGGRDSGFNARHRLVVTIEVHPAGRGGCVEDNAGTGGESVVGSEDEIARAADVSLPPGAASGVQRPACGSVIVELGSGSQRDRAVEEADVPRLRSAQGEDVVVGGAADAAGDGEVAGGLFVGDEDRVGSGSCDGDAAGEGVVAGAGTDDGLPARGGVDLDGIGHRDPSADAEGLGYE